jgi:hypothetical protein
VLELYFDIVSGFVLGHARALESLCRSAGITAMEDYMISR